MFGLCAGVDLSCTPVRALSQDLGFATLVSIASKVERVNGCSSRLVTIVHWIFFILPCTKARSRLLKRSLVLHCGIGKRA